jgi:hypothetical protein
VACGSLDRAWAGKSTPGRYVVPSPEPHRYGNAIRDLLALEIDVDELLPSDGADFGFDNIATSLRTSPLLLERYLDRRQRISTLASAIPTSGRHDGVSISREFSQSAHIDGLPLGTRGGTHASATCFPADAEYKLFGRLVRGVEEGYAGVEGNDTPTPSSSPSTAKRCTPPDRRPQGPRGPGKDMNEAKASSTRA